MIGEKVIFSLQESLNLPPEGGILEGLRDGSS